MNQSTQALAMLNDPEIQRLFQIYFSGGTSPQVSSDIPAPRGPSPGGGGVSGGGGGSGAPADLSPLGAMLAEREGSPSGAAPSSGTLPGYLGGGAQPVPGVDPNMVEYAMGGAPQAPPAGAPTQSMTQYGFGMPGTGGAPPPGDTPPPGVGPPPMTPNQRVGGAFDQFSQAQQPQQDMRLAALAQLLGLA